MGELIVTAAPLLGLLLNMTVQVTIAHVGQRRQTGLALLAGAVAGLVLDAVITANYGYFNVLGTLVWSLLSYLGFSFGYWAFVNLNLTSVRIRVLKELLRSPGGRLSLSALLQKYDGHELVKRRLARLEAAGQVARRGDNYVLAGFGLVWGVQLTGLLRKMIIPSPRGEEP